MYVSAVVEQPPTPGGRLNKNEKDKVSSIKEIIKSIRIVKWLQVEGEMKSPIRKGDKLEHGGEVTAGSPWTTFMSQRACAQGRRGTLQSARLDLYRRGRQQVS
ncbi:PAAR domain-containing protein [Burkholderia vietnamiensis]|uniref:hypothetical protein n=1 Tax=Burkholderia vietnamiensis TaxID=60552 RepID=UPI00299D9FC7|nr:hypothetical protein [Burkholderia vietnamiensis]